MILWASLWLPLVPLVSDGAQPPLSGEGVSFLDGGAAREVVRTSVGHGVFRDPLTGRESPVVLSPRAIVELRERHDPAALESFVARAQVHVVRELMPSRAMFLVTSAHLDEDGLALAHRLRALVTEGVLVEAYPDLAFPQTIADISVPPNDARYGGQYYLEDVHAEQAWHTSTGDPDTLIVIADNGCDMAHPDLTNKLEIGFDPIDDDDDPSWEPQDGAQHGTSCAGLAAASTDNGIDIAGACPECRLACARLLPGDGEQVFVSADVLTFQYALDIDADVVSNSWGFVNAIPCPAPLRDAIVAVVQDGRGGLGAPVVFAAGNDDRAIGSDELVAVDGVLAVGAVNNIGELTQYTSYGPSIDVVAPTGSLALDLHGADGVDAGDVTNTFGGTSSACPIVSGIAALLVTAAPDLRADEVNDILVRTAKQSALANPDGDGHDVQFGYGLVQADAAMDLALGVEPAEGEGEGEPMTCSSSAHTHERRGLTGGVLAALVLVQSLKLKRSARRSSSA